MKITNETTYKELVSALPTTGDSRVPGIKQLQKKAKSLHRQETACGIIEIYDNGFYTYAEDDRTTVYGVDRCARMEWIQRPEGADDQEACDLGPLPYELVLEMAGSYRLEQNADSREASQKELYLDAPESENNILFSVLPEHEIRELEEEEAEWRAQRNRLVAEEIDSLRDDQRDLIEMYFVKNMKQEEIADRFGIDRTSANRRIATVKKRFEKFF